MNNIFKINIYIIFFLYISNCKTIQIKDNYKLIFSEELGPQLYHSEINKFFLLPNGTKIPYDAYYTKRHPIGLLIFVHGNKSQKEAHAKQAKFTASWGFKSIILQLPREKEWIQNGYRIRDIILQLRPPRKSFLQEPMNLYPIILIGHSFGGSAVSIAAGLQTPISGLILLDPALYRKKVIRYLKNIRVPVVLLCADKTVFYARNRALFYRHIHASILEFSFANTTHNDAQYPSIEEIHRYRVINTKKKHQEIFKKFILIACMAILNKDNFEDIWQILRPRIANGTIIEAKSRILKQIF